MNENFLKLQEEALDENTSPKRLKQLANYSDINIRKVVTQNPNTPIDVLWKLGEDFPSELLENAILDLLFLENHNFWLKTPVETLRSIVSVPEISSNILARISKHNDLEVLAKIAIHPHTSTETLKSLSRHNTLLIKMVAKAAINVNWYQQKSDILLGNNEFICQQLFTNIDPSIRREIAKSHNTPQFILEILANDESEGVRLGVVRHNNTPLHILAKLANDESEGVRLGVAIHNNTPLYVLAKLANDSSKWVKLGLLENSKTPTIIIDKLVQNSDEEILEKLPLCFQLSLSTLKILAKTPYIEVRKNIIKRLNSPLDYAELLMDMKFAEFEQKKSLLEMLAEDPDKVIRLALVKHSKTPLYILKRLTQDSEFSIYFRAYIKLLMIVIKYSYSQSKIRLKYYVRDLRYYVRDFKYYFRDFKYYFRDRLNLK